MAVTISTEKTLLSLPACTNDGRDGVQPPACLPLVFLTGDRPATGMFSCGSGVCLQQDAESMLVSLICALSSYFTAAEGSGHPRGVRPPHGIEVRMFSPSQESGDPTRTLASQKQQQSFPGTISPLLSVCTLHGPSLGK